MSAPVDVLAWFDAEIETADSLSADAYQVEHAARLRIYRAAVAELTEAAKRIRLGYDFDTPVVIGLADLHSALARVQGGAK